MNERAATATAGAARLPTDAFYARAALSPGAFFLCTAVHWWLVWLAGTELGTRAVGVRVEHVIAANVLCELFHAINVWVIGPQRILAPALWWYRGFSYVVMLPTLLVYGAGSTLELSPAWIVALDAPLLFAPATPGSPFLTGLLTLSPLLLRLLLVPHPSLLSLAMAAAIGVMSGFIYTRRSRRAQQLKRLGEQREAEAALTAQAQRREASLDVAMSLHDGLSGALFATRQRLSRADADESVVLARELALHARGVLFGIRGRSAPPQSLREVQQALVAFGRLLLVDVQVTTPRESASLDADELEDLREMALELMANAVRHARASRIELVLAAEPGRVRLSCASVNGQAALPVLAPTPTRQSAPRAKSAGRGLRNIELRIAARGGAFGLVPDGEGLRAELSWPRSGTGPTSYWARLWPEFPAGLLVAVLLASVNTSLASLVCVAANVPFLIWVTFAMERSVTRARAGLAQERGLRRRAEAAPNLSLAAAALSEPLGNLESGVVAGDAARCGEALEGLALTLGDLLWSLEWRGEAAELLLDLREPDADLLALAEAAGGAASGRFELRRALRTRARSALAGA